MQSRLIIHRVASRQLSGQNSLDAISQVSIEFVSNDSALLNVLVDTGSVTNPDHQDKQLVILDFIHDPIHALPDPIEIMTR